MHTPDDPHLSSRTSHGKRAAVRRRVVSLKRRLRESRKRTRVASGVAVLATIAALVLAFQPEPAPQPVSLGSGRAGVFTVSDRGERPDRPTKPDTTRADASTEGGPTEEGAARYSGEEFEGRPTASGEPFAQAALTAAHRTLPIGTRVRVTNVSTQESVVVRVNDRGPFAKRRVIDLSKAAAREIGMLESGTAHVQLELLRGTRV